MTRPGCAAAAGRDGAICGEGIVEAVATAIVALSAGPRPALTCDAVATALDGVVVRLLERGWSTDDALCAWNVAEGFRSDEPGTATMWRERLASACAARDRDSALRAMAAMPCRLSMVARAAAEALAA